MPLLGQNPAALGPTAPNSRAGPGVVQETFQPGETHGP